MRAKTTIEWERFCFDWTLKLMSRFAEEHLGHIEVTQYEKENNQEQEK